MNTEMNWFNAKQEVNDYQALHDYVCSIAGEGDEVDTANFDHQFTFDRVLMVKLPGVTGQSAVYSMDPKTSEIDVELIS